MRKIFEISKRASVLGLAAGLCACNVAPVKRDTYNAIKEQVAGAVATTSPAAQSAAVENALLPPASALAAQLPKARGVLDERFNVAFNNVPARQFFHSLVNGTRYNMLVHPDVQGNISANLKDVTLFEALDAVREMYGYDYKVDGTRIAIRPLTMQTRMFQVNYLTGNRKGTSNLRVSSTSVGNAGTSNNQSGQSSQQSPQNQTQQPGQPGSQVVLDSSNLSTTSDSNFWAELKESLGAIIGGTGDGRKVVISPQSGVVVVRGMPDELRAVDLYLKATQLSVDRQVILEAKILEVELNDNFQTGINWASFASIKSGHTNRISTGFIQPGGTLAPLPFNGGQPPNMTNGNGLTASSGFGLSSAATAAGSMFGLAFQTANFAAMITFLESQGAVHVLSSPRIATMNNQKAVLKIGTDEFFVTGVSTTVTSTGTTGGTTSSPNVTLQPFFSGVVLDVTPQIDDQGNIILHVHPSVSQVTTVSKQIDLGSAGSLKLPLAASSTSEMDSMVRSQDGRIVAIGGLMRQATTSDRSQVPGAGDIPVLGALFRNTGQVIQKRELVVLIKPTIVEGANSWNEDLLDSGKRIEALDPRRPSERR
ncbi:MAG: pilus (MSHA type) biogenesis protein MshL [Burkholderiales bacterium]|uniref:Pilus (MSHA type) biogenesis protein MshL n=1 Tax=Janthinobacterium tructae TaxID=2590869 RepID=A0A4Y6RLS6_9BURK|nr:pilus (MSHA type) biogenesis protein MshL [Janthinobacterium tructae]MBH1984767.1 pilus (MSHA type) biogenesis protein MshL [Burkholderiales bacterium]MBH2067663.1 pilus (MSHA type) biogenesis protein MshL [Burkholderiales bacterium]QDG73992.1 pilus (MSHA type) biogenesis protein MshL [Janthinobacterium tructae]